MRFDQLDPNDLSAAISEIADGNRRVAVTLTDGVTLGGLMPLSELAGPQTEEHPVRSQPTPIDHVVYLHGTTGHVAIPFDAISGFSLQEFGTDFFGDLERKELLHSLDEDLFSKARQHNFEIFSQTSTSIDMFFERGAHKGNSVYRDWEWAKTHRPESGEVGIQVLATGATFGGGKSLDGFMRGKLKKKGVALDRLCASKKPVVIVGHPMLFDAKEDSKMVQAGWRPIVVSAEQPSDQGPVGGWALAGWNNNAAPTVPLNVWPQLGKLRLFGEVLRLHCDTPFGSRDCFLRLYAANQTTP